MRMRITIRLEHLGQRSVLRILVVSVDAVRFEPVARQRRGGTSHARSAYHSCRRAPTGRSGIASDRGCVPADPVSSFQRMLWFGGSSYDGKTFVMAVSISLLVTGSSG